MIIEQGNTISQKKGEYPLSQFIVRKIVIDPVWPMVMIHLLRLDDGKEVILDFDNLCDWFKKTEWEIRA